MHLIKDIIAGKKMGPRRLKYEARQELKEMKKPTEAKSKALKKMVGTARA